MIPDTLEPLAVPIAGLSLYKRNPRQGDIGAITESLKRHGQYRPIVVNARTQEVLAGNHTLAAARELGWTEIAATFVDVDEDQAARIVLVDNRSNDLAAYDDAELIELLRSLPDLEGTGYDGDALDELMQQFDPVEPGRDTDPGEVPAEPRTKPGDLWLLGEHRLLCGSSADHGCVTKTMGNALAQMVMADPPYNVDYRGGSGPGGKTSRPDAYHDRFDDYAGFLMTVLSEAYLASDDKAALHVWHAFQQERAVLAAIGDARWTERTLIVWDKGSIKGGIGQASKQYRTRCEPMWYCHKKGKTPRWYGPGNEADVWEETGPSANPLHPTMKPIPLYERSISNHTKTGDIVLECFGGSGTTMIAAENMKRRARLIELDPGYCDVIVDRWERHTGQTAVLQTP